MGKRHVCCSGPLTTLNPYHHSQSLSPTIYLSKSQSVAPEKISCSSVDLIRDSQDCYLQHGSWDRFSPQRKSTLYNVPFGLAVSIPESCGKQSTTHFFSTISVCTVNGGGIHGPIVRP